MCANSAIRRRAFAVSRWRAPAAATRAPPRYDGARPRAGRSAPGVGSQSARPRPVPGRARLRLGGAPDQARHARVRRSVEARVRPDSGARLQMAWPLLTCKFARRATRAASCPAVATARSVRAHQCECAGAPMSSDARHRKAPDSGMKKGRAQVCAPRMEEVASSVRLARRRPLLVAPLPAHLLACLPRVGAHRVEQLGELLWVLLGEETHRLEPVIRRGRHPTPSRH